MKIRNKIIFIIISIFIITFINMFIFTKKIYYSENEFRYLTKFNEITLETILSRDTMDNIEEYISDHFPLRETFIKLKNNFELYTGKQKINNVIITKDYLIEANNKITKKDQIIEVINNFKKINKDVDVSVMLVPTSISINDEILPSYLKDDTQIKEIEEIYSKLENINTYNLYNVLNDSKKQIYYKTDHHWTTYGAYLAYKEFTDNDINIELIKVTDKFQGTLYSKILIKDLYDDIYLYEPTDELRVKYNVGNEVIVKDTLYNKSYLNKKDKYSVFLDNNKPVIEITNNTSKKDNNILIIKDSYANSFIPFLTNDYKTIHVIDPRYYKMSISEYILKNNIEEVLFLYNANSINNDTGIFTVR